MTTQWPDPVGDRLKALEAALTELTAFLNGLPFSSESHDRIEKIADLVGARPFVTARRKKLREPTPSAAEVNESARGIMAALKRMW